MLPDLRIVIAAVLSTFILTVGVGFFASSRLINEQMAARLDSRNLDDTPVNRIALNWPEPTSTERNVNLDFAVSAKAARNPVRDVTPATEETAAPLPAAPAMAADQPSAPLKAVAQTPEPPEATSGTPEVALEGTTPPATEAAAETPIEAKAQSQESRAPDTRVTVYPDQPATVESTGSIAAPPPAMPAEAVPDPQPKMAARTQADESPPVAASQPVVTQQKTVTPVVRRKHPRRAAKHRPTQRPATLRPTAQNQQPQLFDFFGLFRNPPAPLRLPPQTQAPASPVS